MAWILNLETATGICSVALAQDGVTVTQCETREERAHAAQLTHFIATCLSEAFIGFHQVDAVAVSIGPGSYTGLRIGLATAKGLCYALEKPLIAINTLEAMAAGWFENRNNQQSDWVCPMIDARRMEVYAAVFDRELKEVLPTAAVVMEEHSFAETLENQVITFLGDGMPKCRELLSRHPTARFDPDAAPSASAMAGQTFKYFTNSRFEDLAAAGPLYLKEFMGTKPGKSNF